jgi:GcrA cell cycle regulator
MTWTAETKEAACALRRRGLTTREIVADLLARFGMKTTKNSVQHMLRRAGVKPGTGLFGFAAPQPRQPYRDPKWPFPATPESVTLPKLEIGQCRWPVATDPAEMQLFCAAPAQPGKPYCKEHADAARGS